MKRLFVYLAVVMSAFLGITASASAKCGDVTMAEMNWASAELMANIDKVILEKGYGLAMLNWWQEPRCRHLLP